MTTRQWKELAGLVGIGVAAMLLWDTAWVWPFKILVVLFHELGHALAAIATGGEVLSIELVPEQGGLTMTRGGNRFVVSSSGYLGSLAFGVLWLFLGQTPKRARFGVWFMALVLVISTLTWVRPLISFGFGFSFVAAAAAVAMARYAPAAASRFTLRAIGVFSVLYALWDIRDDVLARPGAPSDAVALAEMTFIPSTVWGLIWLAVGVSTIVVLRKWIL